MPKLQRKIAKIFGLNSPTDRVAVVGSLRAGAPSYSKDPDALQALPNFEEGWPGVAIGNSSPPLEDMNALQYCLSYNIATIMQSGVPEWHDETEYFIGSMVNVDGVIYISTADDNIGYPVTDGTKWKNAHAPDVTDVVGEDAYSILPTDQYIRVDPVGSSMNLTSITLPLLSTLPVGHKLIIKNVAGILSSATVRISVADGSESMDERTQIELSCNPKESITLVKANDTTWDII